MNSNEVIKKKDFFYGHFSDRNLVTRYIMAGGTGALVNLASMYVLTDILGVWYIASAIFAFLISLVVTFFLQKMWTFGDVALHPQHALRQVALYTASSVSFLGLNTLILYLLVEFLDVWYLLAQFFSLGVVALGSFLFNKSVTFRKSEGNNINTEQ
ncbi:MAG: GtrA family protein [Patescibacteria group bacterium]